MRPILAFNRFSFGWLVSTLGFAVIVENARGLYLGPDVAGLSADFQPDRAFTSVGAVLTGQQLLAIVRPPSSPLGFELVRRHTLFGKLGMATAADPEMATAIGVNTTVVAIVAFAASAFFAGVAGVLIGPTTFANPYLGDTFGTYGFIAMMIGGGTEKPIAAMFGGVFARRLRRGRQCADQFAGLRLVSVYRPRHHPDCVAARVVQRGKPVPARDRGAVMGAGVRTPA